MRLLNLGAITFLAGFLGGMILVGMLYARVPADATEQHRYADGVLLPRFHAAVNDWSYQHPQDPPGKPWQHVQTLDAGDVKRWRLVRETFRELDAAMKRAGY